MTPSLAKTTHPMERKNNKPIHLLFFQIDEADLEAELDALGDELQFDTDTSYLDEAISAPSVPTREPRVPIVNNFFL